MPLCAFFCSLREKMLHNSMLRLLNWTEIIISQPPTSQKTFIWKYPPMKCYSPALYHELNGCAKTDFFFFFSKLSFQNQCEVVPLQTLILAARWAHTHKQFPLLARLGDQASDREGPRNIKKSQVFGCEKASAPRPESYRGAGPTCLPRLTGVNRGAEEGKVKGLDLA